MIGKSGDPSQQRFDLSTVDHVAECVVQVFATVSRRRQFPLERRRIGSPTNCQSTVRSFGSRLNVSPWSMPQTLPVSSRRQWLIFRSALFTMWSNSTIRSIAGSRLLQKSWRSWRSPSGWM